MIIPHDLTVGIQVYRHAKMIIIKPLPLCSFIFRLRLQPKRPVLDTVCEMVLVISAANVIALAFAAVIGYLKHREEVIGIFQYLISAIPFL